MFDKDTLTGHIKDQETVFKMRQIIDKAIITQNKHIVSYTDFLDPYQRKMAISILNRFDDIRYMESGGIDEAERKILAIFPDYMNSFDIAEGVEAIRISSSEDGLMHKDYLGTILSLGIKREKIGDIYIFPYSAILILKSEITDFIMLNLQKVRNAKVELRKIMKSEIVRQEDEYLEESHFISSFRLDSIISAAFKLSRNESLEVIKSGLIKINHEKIDKASKEVDEGDLISVRGKGRVILFKINGQSKKGRYNIVLRKLK